MEGLKGEREKGRKREAQTSGGFSGEAPIGDMSPGAPRLDKASQRLVHTHRKGFTLSLF